MIFELLFNPHESRYFCKIDNVRLDESCGGQTLQCWNNFRTRRPLAPREALSRGNCLKKLAQPIQRFLTLRLLKIKDSPSNLDQTNNHLTRASRESRYLIFGHPFILKSLDKTSDFLHWDYFSRLQLGAAWFGLEQRCKEAEMEPAFGVAAIAKRNSGAVLVLSSNFSSTFD